MPTTFAPLQVHHPRYGFFDPSFRKSQKQVGNVENHLTHAICKFDQQAQKFTVWWRLEEKEQQMKSKEMNSNRYGNSTWPKCAVAMNRRTSVAFFGACIFHNFAINPYQNHFYRPKPIGITKRLGK